MKAPRFSILLPTKNRSEIVGGAVESALKQSFGDFELVVSDNDDSETATRDVIQKYSDSRIRYFRTSGRLPMHENWENALNQARGDHVVILEDKMRLASNALEILDACLKKYGDVVLSFDLRFTSRETAEDPNREVRVKRWTTAEAIREFARFSQKFFYLHPKGLDSCAPRELLLAARKFSPTGMVFSYVCPDYSSGFLLLSQLESFYFINAPLLYVPNNWMGDVRYSNGQATYKKAALIRRFLDELPIAPGEIESFVPVKCKWMWLNMVLYDFFTKFRHATVKTEVNWVHYHAFCLIIVLLGKRIGADMKEEQAGIKSSLAQRSIGFKVRVYLNFLVRLTEFLWGVLVRRLRR